MAVKIHDCEQRSEEWFELKRGLLSSSTVSLALAKTKSGWGASRDNLMTQLVMERLGIPVEGFTSLEMQWGIDTEPEARNAYSFITDNEVQEVGFVTSSGLEGMGASPDGLIDHDGLLEIKCPAPKTHMKTMLTGKYDYKYWQQMQFQMMICDRQWCDFVSYDPRMPPHLQFWTRRVYRMDNDEMHQFAQDCRDFVTQLEERMKQLEKVEPIANVA